MKYLVTSRPARSLRPAGFMSDFDKVLDSFFPEAPYWDTRNPQVDIYKEEGQYVLSAELPGLSEENLDIKVEGNLLTLSAEKGKEKEAEKENVQYLLRERSSHAFKRSFVLPKDVDTEKISAEFKNGILTLVMKISEKAQPRSISINVK